MITVQNSDQSTLVNKKLSYYKESMHLTLLYHGLAVRKFTVLTNSDLKT